MSGQFRKLNDEGLRRFADWLAGGAIGEAPTLFLIDPETSDPFAPSVQPEQCTFCDRFEFGQYLVKLLGAVDVAAVSHDRGLWSALALFWFDQVCSSTNAGPRKVEKEYRYILSHDFRHCYLHLVRS